MTIQTLYIEILERLAATGIGFECEIIDLFGFDEPEKDKIGAIGLLETIQDNRHITYEVFPNNIEVKPISSVMASITFLGMDYLITHKTAIKTQKSFRSQKWFNAFSILILSATLYCSIQSILKDNLVLRELNEAKTTFQLQQSEINKLQDSVATLKKRAIPHPNSILKEK